jgi:hypothetical protein
MSVLGQQALGALRRASRRSAALPRCEQEGAPRSAPGRTIGARSAPPRCIGERLPTFGILPSMSAHLNPSFSRSCSVGMERRISGVRTLRTPHRTLHACGQLLGRHLPFAPTLPHPRPLASSDELPERSNCSLIHDRTIRRRMVGSKFWSLIGSEFWSLRRSSRSEEKRTTMASA